MIITWIILTTSINVDRTFIERAPISVTIFLEKKIQVGVVYCFFLKLTFTLAGTGGLSASGAVQFDRVKARCFRSLPRLLIHSVQFSTTSVSTVYACCVACESFTISASYVLLLLKTMLCLQLMEVRWKLCYKAAVYDITLPQSNGISFLWKQTEIISVWVMFWTRQTARGVYRLMLQFLISSI